MPYVFNLNKRLLCQVLSNGLRISNKTLFTLTLRFLSNAICISRMIHSSWQDMSLAV